jgi:hypothetical protein
MKNKTRKLLEKLLEGYFLGGSGTPEDDDEENWGKIWEPEDDKSNVPDSSMNVPDEENEENGYPMFSEMPYNTAHMIYKASLKPDFSVEYESSFEDDGQITVQVVLDGRPVSFWWLGLESAGAFVYPDSPTAMTRIRKLIKDHFEDIDETI